LAAAVSMVLAGRDAFGQPARFLSPSRGETLRSGAVILVEWPAGVLAGEDADEMELLLSLDGGARFDVRVSGEIDLDATRLQWRVPALPTRHARLALRTGMGGRESERIRILSDEFEILAESDSREEPLLSVDGERRTQEAVRLPDRAGVPAPAVTSEPALLSRGASETAGISRQTDPVEPPLLRPPGKLFTPSASIPSLVEGPSEARRILLPLRE